MAYQQIKQINYKRMAGNVGGGRENGGRESKNGYDVASEEWRLRFPKLQMKPSSHSEILAKPTNSTDCNRVPLRLSWHVYST